MTSEPPRPDGALRHEMLSVGPLEVNCHLIARVRGVDDGHPVPCVVIDPGDDADRIARRLDALRWTPAAILLTHAHYDHIGAVEALRARYPGVVLMAGAETSRRIGDPRTNLSVLLGAAQRVSPVDREIEDGVAFTAADVTFEPTEVPGHDPGEMVYGVREAGWLFTGDVLFAESIGRSDFPGGDAEALVAGVAELLDAWPDDTAIFPGHGPDTTVGHEKRTNPFLR